MFNSVESPGDEEFNTYLQIAGHFSGDFNIAPAGSWVSALDWNLIYPTSV